MLLQRISFCDNTNINTEIYARITGKYYVQNNQLFIYQGGRISTDTYMNSFDIGAWKKYTDLSELCLVWRIRGKGQIRIIWERMKEGIACLEERSLVGLNDGISEGWYNFRSLSEMTEGILYFIFTAEEDTFLESWYETGGGKSDERN